MTDLPVVANAPMAGIAGGALDAAVTAAGGLGFIGGGYGDPAWIDDHHGAHPYLPSPTPSLRTAAR